MQNSIRDGVRHLIAEELGLYPMALDTYERTVRDDLTVDGDIGYSSLFLQSYLPRDPVVVGYLVARIHAAVMAGEASAVRVHVGSEPRPDREVAANTAALANLPAPFEAAMVFGKSDSDGQLVWDPSHPKPPFPGSPLDRVPLEVGRTDIETLFWHFCQCGGFARWPYGCEWIIAIGKLDPRPRDWT